MGELLRKEADYMLVYVKQVRKQNRQLHKTNPKKGIRRENKAPGYVHGYQLFDKVEYLDRECFVFGRRSSGYFDLRTLDGEVVSRSASVGLSLIHISEPTRLLSISYAVFCLKKTKVTHSSTYTYVTLA